MNVNTTSTCTTTTDFHPEANRYEFDYALLPHGWQQWDTDQDAGHFGIWVHPTHLKIFTFAEGDTILQEFSAPEAYEAELKKMSSLYGPVPPAFTTFTPGAGITAHYAPRPMTAEAPALELA